MAAGDSSDVLMRFVAGGNALDAECQTLIDPSDVLVDPLIKDFKNGQFCEVDEFSFGMSLDDKDPTQDKVGQSPSGGTGNSATGGASPAGQESKMRGKFGDWKYASKLEQQNMKPYPLRMDEFTLTRCYDRMSPVLFHMCCNSESLDSATLVKRRTIGEEKLRGFFRIDFKEVLITHVQWKNTEPMSEELRLIFRKIQVQYCVTAFDARTKTVGMKCWPPVDWSYEAQLVQTQGR